MQSPGSVTLMGSGETSPMAGQVYEMLARQLLVNSPLPLKISVLETPAGFEANAQRVAGRVVEFFNTRLQNYHPHVETIAARKKGTPLSPDAPEIVAPLYESQMIFFGPGSPTYTVRQLSGSLAWQIIQARQRLGANLVLASAAIISISAQALPVYEIYKVGEDVHWKPGLDFFRPYGLNLAIIPHWNNHEGGDELDTSRCFMGLERFTALQAMLPPGITIAGIDEHTALTIDFETQTCIVRGIGEVHILRDGTQEDCSAGCSYPITQLGHYHPLESVTLGITEEIWQKAVSVQAQLEMPHEINAAIVEIPGEVHQLVEERQRARQEKDWALADQIREQLTRLGWQVKDTPDGPIVARGE
jgi:hypothetical protein